MRTNRSSAAVLERTHEGGKAEIQKPEIELERAVSSCLLFEDTFYEKENDLAGRIEELCLRVPNDFIYRLAIRARTQLNLRHAPLWLLRCAAKKPGDHRGLGGALAATIQRADELPEFLALYWKDGRQPLSAQVKRGLGRAFGRFSAHQLSKWNREDAVKLRDVMFLTHPKPENLEQVETFKQLAAGTLKPPDTWEVALSSGKDKKETWERLLSGRKLGIMALLMNLRNMEQAGVPRSSVASALKETKKSRAFPYRFLTAARHAPWLAQELSEALLERISEMPKLSGETHVLVDVSGSMDDKLSGRGDAIRLDAAACLAVCAREVCESARVLTFSNACCEVSNVRGLGLAQAIASSQPRGGTYLDDALNGMKQKLPTPDRLIAITDEQANDGIPFCHARRHGYIVNVAPYKPGLQTKSRNWVRINGWSDRLLDWIRLEEHQAER